MHFQRALTPCTTSPTASPAFWPALLSFSFTEWPEQEGKVDRKIIPANNFFIGERLFMLNIFIFCFLSLFPQGDFFTASWVSTPVLCSACNTEMSAILTILRTELPNCRTCTGFFNPNSTGPMASEPPSSATCYMRHYRRSGWGRSVYLRHHPPIQRRDNFPSALPY